MSGPAGAGVLLRTVSMRGEGNSVPILTPLLLCMSCAFAVPCVVAAPCQQEEKAIAEGVRVRDAWDGSIQDIELEVTGFQRQQFTEEQERAAVESAVSSPSSPVWV